MTYEELNEILRKHELWLKNKEGGERADLRSASLYGANLTDAILSDAVLSSADLSDANLQGAILTDTDLDFSCLTLWCGGLDDTKVNEPAPAATDTSSKNNNPKYKYTPNCEVCQARIAEKLKNIAECLCEDMTDFLAGEAYGRIYARIDELESGEQPNV